MNELELAELMKSLTFRLLRLTEISEANVARRALVIEQFTTLSKQAIGMQNTLNNLRAAYNSSVPPAGAPGEQREAAETVTRQELREASPESVELPSSDRA
jgi:hypothetical protein